MPFGPHLQAVCVIAKDTECSWLTARLQGQYDILDAEGLLVDINDQVDCFFFYFYESKSYDVFHAPSIEF